jgi:SAM-dependent methyltransferase
VTAIHAGELAARARNLMWERRLRIVTRGWIPADYPDSVHYATMSYSAIWSVLDQLQLRSSDVFVDVGSGLGRVLCCASRLRVRQVLGVDVSADLCQQARTNALRLRGRRAPITVTALPAQHFDYSAATALYLFDPFGAVTLKAVLAKVRHDRRGRGVRFAYANPTHAEIFDRQEWLERTARWDRADTGLEHSIHFYRSVPAA